MVTLPEKGCANHHAFPVHEISPSLKFTANTNAGCTVKVHVHAQIADERATTEELTQQGELRADKMINNVINNK